MELNFLGRGAAFHILEGNTSAYFIEDDILFLIDCGEVVFEKIVERGLLNHINTVYVFVSHMHSDHCGSLGSFGLYSQYRLRDKLKIVVPHHDEYVQQLKTLMTLFGNTDKAYEFIYEEELDNKFKSFSKVRYDHTLHAYELICFSFVFETDKGGLFFSADTRTLDNIKKFIETHEVIDKMYMEATNSNIPGDIHLHYDGIINEIDKKYHSKIWMMHFRNDQCMKEIEDAGLNIVSYKD